MSLLFTGGYSRWRLSRPALEQSRFYSPLPAEDPLGGDVAPVHDPSMIRERAGSFRIFSTDINFVHSKQLLPQRCSPDLLRWHACGFVFQSMPAWIRAEFPTADGLWAPDISFFHGAYHLYYAVSALGSQHSAIGLATNTTLDPKSAGYRWVDQGEVLSSKGGDDVDAIDANIVLEPSGGSKEPRVWLNYGSFWKGIFQQEVDPATGKLLPGGERFHLAEQPSARGNAIEAAAMIEHHGWYYLFASVGSCCDLPIERDTYQQVVGRSRSIHGPFVAENGTGMLKGGATVLLSKNKYWLAPGGGSLWQSEDKSETLLTFHALHRSEQGALDLWVERVDWQDDWPVLRPLQ